MQRTAEEGASRIMELEHKIALLEVVLLFFSFLCNTFHEFLDLEINYSVSG